VDGRDKMSRSGYSLAQKTNGLDFGNAPLKLWAFLYAY